MERLKLKERNTEPVLENQNKHHKNKTIPRIAARLSRVSTGCVKYLDVVTGLHFLHIKPSNAPDCCTIAESHHNVSKPVVIKHNTAEKRS